LRWTLLGLIGALGLGGISTLLFQLGPWQTGTVGGALALGPWQTGTFGGTIAAGTVDEIKDGDVIRYPQGKFWLARYKEPALGNRSVLLALYWKCAHLGCTVPWKPDESFQGHQGIFHCPCHGSIYTRTGQNLAGPAGRPLDIIAIRLAGGQIAVDTGKITQRVQYDPAQATPIG